MVFFEWFYSVQIPIIYLAICITIPSTALYIAEIVTIVRHKKFHNSFYALFVMRAIPDLLYVLDSFYGYRLPSIIGAVLYPIYSKFPNWMLAMFYFFAGHTLQANNLVTAFILLNRLTAIIMPIKHEKLWHKFLPFITIFVLCVPTLLYWPAFKMNAIILLKDPNSTTDRSFVIYEAEDEPYFFNYSVYINTASSVIFTISCVLINIATFLACKQQLKRVGANGNNFHNIERKLLFYAFATFLGHMLVASMFLMIPIITNLDDPKTKDILFIYNTLVMDTGTVMLSSWLLLWANGTLRRQLIKDFAINRIKNNRVGPMEGPRNNNHRPVGGAVGHQLQDRISRQLPPIA
uniref:Serpentine receptor class gamma n=1 Tax=Globodera rostochiensis TaxID=31243 RepID=A0A914HS26_GLORO